MLTLHAKQPSPASSQHRGASTPITLTCTQLQTGRSRAPDCLRPRAAAVQTSGTDVVNQLSAIPSIVSLGQESWQPSGQSASQAFDGALCGSPAPFGASLDSLTQATNFALYSSTAQAVSLCLFTEQDLQSGRTTFEIPLHPQLNRTGDVWHIALPRLDSRLLYAYRVTGPHQDVDADAEGMRHDGTAIVLDPYARVIFSRRRWGQLAPELDYTSTNVLGFARTWPQAAASLPIPHEDFDWQGDTPLNRSMAELVIYETHVRGFTQHGSSRVGSPGTYQGMTEKLDYLKQLGINCIELLPTFEFNELEYYTPIPGSDSYRFNFWGYSTVGFFAPMSRFSAAMAAGGDGGAVQRELKTLVRECHKRGIEVILDVVFNHTAEGNELGPCLSFRGIDNRTYYMLAPRGEYYNYSGCGNTLNCNHPVVLQMIVDSLRYWVQEYHIDGFRFDLASILTRAHSAWHKQETDPLTGERAALHSGGAVVDHNGIMTDGAGVPTGTPLSDPPLVEMISEDPVLRNTKLIAEAWDCDGLKQVGAFPHYGGRWAEWNGNFRDTVRNFIKGTDGPWAGAFAQALCGSPDLYGNPNPHDGDWWASNAGRKWKGHRQPTHSINFITAHDGFTLADLVSYNEKHNEANGEDNRDGESHNASWNCGEEGVTTKLTVKQLRARQMRNLAAALFVAQGVPMMMMGDEYGHTKSGNNNTYCHDSPLNWFDWDAAESDSMGMLRFVRSLITLRRSHPELRNPYYISDDIIQWHGILPHQPDWSESSRIVAFTLSNKRGGGLYVAFNAAHVPQLMQLPQWPGRVWQPIVDSGKAAPFDVLVPDAVLSEADCAAQRAAAGMWVVNHAYPMLPWSCIILESCPESEVPETGLSFVAQARGGKPGAFPSPSTPRTPPASPPRRSW